MMHSNETTLTHKVETAMSMHGVHASDYFALRFTLA